MQVVTNMPVTSAASQHHTCQHWEPMWQCNIKKKISWSHWLARFVCLQLSGSEVVVLLYGKSAIMIWYICWARAYASCLHFFCSSVGTELHTGATSRSMFAFTQARSHFHASTVASGLPPSPTTRHTRPHTPATSSPSVPSHSASSCVASRSWISISHRSIMAWISLFLAPPSSLNWKERTLKKNPQTGAGPAT